MSVVFNLPVDWRKDGLRCIYEKKTVNTHEELESLIDKYLAVYGSVGYHIEGSTN